MTNRERFLRTLNFLPVDRLPVLEWATWWDLTVARWKGEGLGDVPEIEGLNPDEALRAYLDLDLLMQEWVPFTTPQTPKPTTHGAPILETLEDYERIRPMLYPSNQPDVRRMRDMAARSASGEAVTWLTLDGFFWAPRTLLGIEPHLYAFYDQPELLHRICGDLTEYYLRVLERVFAYLTPDFMTFAEDMSYNLGPMLSEALFDEFLLPYYQQIVPVLKARGVRVFVDTDGDVTKMVPWLERAGIEGVLPLERQAGVDANKLRAKHPDLLMLGHFDKMTMPRGEAAMRAEFERLLPVMRSGGFVAGVDHQTPPSVSLTNYRLYLDLFREYARLAAAGADSASGGIKS